MAKMAFNNVTILYSNKVVRPGRKAARSTPGLLSGKRDMKKNNKQPKPQIQE
jgi:hypothetical protein